MKKKIYFKDLIYISIIFILFISNLLAIIFIRSDGVIFLSVLSTVVSIILSLIAIFYSFLSGSKIDAKIDELRQTMYNFAITIHEKDNVFDKLKDKVVSLKQLDNNTNNIEITSIESEIDNLKQSLSIVTNKMLYPDIRN